MNNINNFKPILFLITAWLIVLISFYFETIASSSLFSRSGSLLVLFAVIVKNMLIKGRNEYHHSKLKAYTVGQK
jgi:hypothetical protein